MSVKCVWCLKERPKFSDWEQQRLGIVDPSVKGEWAPLCRPCATRRLRNPMNALLLGMRKRSEAAR